jgi:hypothetical protein
MDVKATFAGSDRETLLSNCEFGEDAAQKLYQQALDADDPLPADIRQLVANQKAALKVSHDTIKKFRDMYRNTDVPSGTAGATDHRAGTGISTGTDAIADFDPMSGSQSGPPHIQ